MKQQIGNCRSFPGKMETQEKVGVSVWRLFYTPWDIFELFRAPSVAFEHLFDFFEHLWAPFSQKFRTSFCTQFKNYFFRPPLDTFKNLFYKNPGHLWAPNPNKIKSFFDHLKFWNIFRHRRKLETREIQLYQKIEIQITSINLWEILIKFTNIFVLHTIQSKWNF